MSDASALMQMAYNWALTSPDPRTQMGAIILTRDGTVIGGANTLPFGVEVLPERLEPPAKYDYINHAERNAIAHAARLGVCTNDSIMICPWSCHICALSIIDSGIKEVINHDIPIYKELTHWDESRTKTMQLFKEAKVNIQYITDHIGMKIRVNGREIEV